MVKWKCVLRKLILVGSCSGFGHVQTNPIHFSRVSGARSIIRLGSSKDRIGDFTVVQEPVERLPEIKSDEAIQSKEQENPRITPGELENEKFVCDESVAFWREFQKDGPTTAQENAQQILLIATEFARSRDGADYWLRHVGRTSYFIANALFGAIGFRLHELLVRGRNVSSNVDSILENDTLTSRIFLETVLSYQQDYKRIQEGKYNKPYDMYQNTRQASPFYVAQKTSLFVREAISILARRNSDREEDKLTWLSNEDWPSLYPAYYRNAFHYQTNGWMSTASAQAYETATETLFLGRQDAMQRTALEPLVLYSRERKEVKPMKVLEIACGTGRFMTFVRDNLPLDTEITAIDLSPFYLEEARDNDANWRKVRSRVEEESSNKVNLKPSRLVQAKAEDLPFEDEEFDAVVCVYLFHELPREIRAEVASELARVMKQGGIAVITDSTQLGDRPGFDKNMRSFERYNEPHYGDYIEDNLPLHFESVGLDCMTKTVCSSTKTLSFRKAKFT